MHINLNRAEQLSLTFESKVDQLNFLTGYIEARGGLRETGTGPAYELGKSYGQLPPPLKKTEGPFFKFRRLSTGSKKIMQIPEQTKSAKKSENRNKGSKIGLFMTGFLQVFLVAVNSYLISREQYIPVFFVGGLISFVWTWNVQRIAFGIMQDRITYALGAGCGSLIGLLLSVYALRIFTI